MFTNVFLTVAALVALVAAAPQSSTPASSCSTGTLACCSSYQDAHSLSQVQQFSIMDALDLTALTGQVGTACSPIVEGAGPSGDISCTQQAACCDNVSANGFIAAGCSTVIA